MFVKFVVYLLSVYAVLVFLLYVFQRELIYFPLQGAPDPEAAGVPEMSLMWLETDDGLKLKAWYRPPLEPGLPTIVYFHGNAGHIGHRAFLIKPYLDFGFGVLLATYRGYSDNPGNPTELGLYSDGRAALEFIRKREEASSPVVVFGNSIGAAVAVQMALEHSVDGLVLQSPFTSLVDIGRYHYPYLPIKWLAMDRYDSLSKAGSINVPTLVIYGGEDRIIPPDYSHRLLNAISGPGQGAYIPDKGHNELFEPELVIKFIKGLSKLKDEDGSGNDSQRSN